MNQQRAADGRKKTFVLLRRALLAGAVLGLVSILAAAVALRRPLVALELALAPAPTALPVPVLGISPAALSDTWGAARPGRRHHQGIDIFASRGTPVVANTAGLYLGAGRDSLGGNVVRILGPGPRYHYYAHLERFGTLRRGDLVHPGDVLGYVGTSGNARGTPPHLHYGIYAFPGFALNPYPLLRQR